MIKIIKPKIILYITKIEKFVFCKTFIIKWIEIKAVINAIKVELIVWFKLTCNDPYV